MSQPPIYRPVERFWPYADLSENPSDEELAALDPDLRAALVGAPALPFSLTVVFPAFEGENYARALEIARASAEYRDLYHLVDPVPGTEILIDDRPVPYARDLWLPLVWFLVK